MKRIVLILLCFSVQVSQAKEGDLKDSAKRQKADYEAWRQLVRCIKENPSDRGQLYSQMNCLNKAVTWRADAEKSLPHE